MWWLGKTQEKVAVEQDDKANVDCGCLGGRHPRQREHKGKDPEVGKVLNLWKKQQKKPI